VVVSCGFVGLQDAVQQLLFARAEVGLLSGAKKTAAQLAGKHKKVARLFGKTK